MLQPSLVLAFAALTPAFATPITPGSTVALSALSAAGLTPAGSGVLTGTISPGTFTASYSTQVFHDTNNIYCSGCLDFVYAFTNLGPGVIERTTMFNFDSFLTNVGYIGRNGVTPLFADRTLNGNTLGFQFNTAGVNAGQFSDFLVIQTNATAYTNGLFSIQDGSAGTGNAFQPAVTAMTPELSSLVLLSTGLFGAAAAGLRRKLSRHESL